MKYQPVYLSLLAGSLLGISLLYVWLWPLVFIGATLSMVVIAKTTSPRQAFLCGWLIGTTKILWSLIWFWSTYPLDWLGLEPGLLHILLVCLYWIPAGLTLGLGLGFSAWLFAKYFRPIPKPFTIVVIAFLWVLAEVIGAVIFSIYTLGPGSYVTPGFSFGHTGYALVSIGVFRYAAQIGSVYLMSFFVALISYVFCILSGTKRLFFLAVFLSLIFIIPAPRIDTNDTGLKVAITETSFTTDTKKNPMPLFDRQQAYNDLLRYALASDADVIVLPEDSRISMLFADEDQIFDFIQAITDKEIILIDSLTVNEGGKNFFRALVYDTKTHTRYEFDKQYLVPQGEYVPFVYKTLISLLGEDVSHWAMSKGIYVPGINQSTLNLPDNVPLVLFCFESVTPFGVSKINRAQSPFVAHIVSHAWFKREPYIFWHQLDSMLQTQALFNRIAIVQSANQARAKIYQPNGSIEYPELVAESGYWKMYLTRF